MKNHFCTGRLRSAWRRIGLTFCLLTFVSSTFAADINIHLDGNTPISRKQVQYQCDAQGPRLGLPIGPFTAEYITGGGNSLVLLPINRNTLVFASGLSGSGVRYISNDYVWWEAAGRSVSLRREGFGRTTVSSCQALRRR